MLTELFILGLGVEATEVIRGQIRRDKEMVQAATPKAYHDSQWIHEVLACLVKGVYAADKVRNRPLLALPALDPDPVSDYWTDLGYVPIRLDALRNNAHYMEFEEDRRQVGDLAGNRPVARLMLFRRGDDANLLDQRRIRFHSETHAGQHELGSGSEDSIKPEETKTTLLPKYVVAVRGTMRNRDDFVADFKVLFEVLHAAIDLYEPVMRLIRAIHWYYESEVDHVWVAGHSLGAMIALLATRKLALEDNIVVKTHLFNPPNFPLDQLVKGFAKDALHGMEKLVRALVPTSVRNNSPDFGAYLAQTSTFIGTQLNNMAENVAPGYVHQMEAESRTLMERGYTPYLYVNPNDRICKEFIRHFLEHPRGAGLTAVVSSASPILRTGSRMVINSESSHLVPRAYLIINHWAEGPLQAHKLHQWFLYPTVNLEVRHVQSDRFQ